MTLRMSDSSTACHLREWRERHRLTLADISDLTGVSIAMLSRVERGQRRLAPMTRVAIARRLGVAVRDLFPPPHGPADP